MIKIWLDDVRQPPDNTWNWVKDAPEAISFLNKWVPKLDEEIQISLDFDLGQIDEHGTGMDVAEYLVGLSSPRLRNMSVFIHSMNPVGAAQMRDVLRDRMVTL